MVLRKNTKIDRGYTTVSDDDGINYRTIAETMTNLGFRMNHSSARNYVLRVMKKFAEATNVIWELNLSDERLNELAKSPHFQHGIADVLHEIETMRRGRDNK